MVLTKTNDNGHLIEKVIKRRGGGRGVLIRDETLITRLLGVPVL